jgi:hypothetical protein
MRISEFVNRNGWAQENRENRIKKYLDKPLNLKKKSVAFKKKWEYAMRRIKNSRVFFFVKNNREVPFFFPYSNDHITFSKG